jgi:cobalt-zinc-cadmium efflux system membrane fusion protein
MIMDMKLLWIGTAIFSWAMSGCASKDEITEASAIAGKTIYTEAQIKLADLKTGTLERRRLSSVVSCTGEIEVPPQGMASVTAPLGGYLKETLMVPGAYVKKGQFLAKLSRPEYIVLQQSYLETSGELKFAEQDFRRQEMLQAQNATAEKKMQESESAFAVLKARLSGLKAQLKLIGIDVESLETGNIQSVVILLAPLSGYVTAVNHHPGAFVEPREVIFEIVNVNDLHLHLNVRPARPV